MPDFNPPDWPFKTLKLGEYIAFARQAAHVVQLRRCDFGIAVNQVLAGRKVTELELSMLIHKTRSIVSLGRSNGKGVFQYQFSPVANAI